MEDGSVEGSGSIVVGFGVGCSVASVVSASVVGPLGVVVVVVVHLVVVVVEGQPVVVVGTVGQGSGVGQDGVGHSPKI